MELNKLTKKDWKIIIISLEAMKETYSFLGGFGNKSEEEKQVDIVIKKISNIELSYESKIVLKNKIVREFKNGHKGEVMMEVAEAEAEIEMSLNIFEKELIKSLKKGDL